MFALRVRAFLIAAAAAVAAVLCCGCSESGLGGALEERKPLGTFTDERDGTKYHTVKTGGKKWMTENMRYELKKEEGISYCYDYGDCEDGRLYDWDAALNYACPSGWHLASGREWDDLVLAAGGKDEGGKKLKSKSGWKGSGNGTDAYGFAARPGGYRWHIDKKFYGSGSDGNWWTSTATVSVAYSIAMSSGGNEVSKTALDKRAGYSVRCVEGAGGSEYGKWDGAEFGSYIDTRNNDTTRYKTVKMPDGKTWMAENMKHVTKSGSRCYGYGGGDNSNCNQYGRLYDRNAAAEACPTGWHLADKSDWDDLANSVGGLPTAGMSLKTANGWNNSGNGEDNYGFSAQPGGHFTNDSHNIGAAGYWWTSTSTTAGSADRFYKYMEAGKKSLMEGASATDFLSVRCVADDKGNIPTYSITVISDGIEPYSVGRQEVGKMVTIFAGKDPPGWEFKNWESDDVILDDASKTKRSITFAMPANDITLKAMFVPAEISRTVVDKNGQEYEVVKRGDLWWMAKNLNYKIDDGRNSWCYEDDPKNCENYGRLYNWNTANTVCPEGSRLPSRGDWSDLIVYAGGESAAGEKLKAINDWTYSGSAAGRDELLFSALPGGARSPNGKFDGAKNFGYWWTSMGADADTAEFKSMGYDHNGVRSGSSGKNAGYSVRCVLGEASTYSVTVSAGTGASGVGDYRAGETVNITAGKAPEGKRFKKWESDAGVVFNDAFNEATTFAMLAKNVTVTAEFEFIYRVTVKSDGTGKSGDGSYAEGAAVAINAGKAPEGKRFKNWESAAGVNFDDPKSATASFLMPAKDVTVTAAFEPVVIGNLTDYRDKNKYRTVVIDGVEWMAENLRYDAKSSGSQCYNNCESYGMLYSMDSAKTACPDGWRLASKADWDILAESAGGIGKAGKNLKAANDWGNTVNGNGTDAYKFSALPGGYFDKKINDFDSFLKSGYWWTSTNSTGDNRFYRFMGGATDSMGEKTTSNKDYWYSVRCVKGNGQYTVTVTAGTGGGRYTSGEPVTVTAVTPPGQRFKNWTATGITIADANNATIKFAMPGNAVALTANFESLGGTFVDNRDGRPYTKTQIGKQTWMAENLDYQPPTGNAWCYQNDTAGACGKYGWLYDWNTAKTACPLGWRLPSRVEWNELAEAVGGAEVGGKALKSNSGWNEGGNGTDVWGFSAMPGGARLPNGRFDDIGSNGYWWTATEYNTNNAYYRDMSYYDEYIGEESGGGKGSGMSVRCVLGDTTMYKVTVSSLGAGASIGNNYMAGATVSITAGTAPEGRQFKNWTATGGGVTFANANSSSTTFIMPANAVTVTANFEQLYTVTVSSAGTGASGDGSYATGATVSITAGTAPEGQKFKNWTATGSGVTFANANYSSTTFTMPANTVMVTANFEPSYAVTVSSAGTSASGGGGYVAGATVNIKAGTAPAGQTFKNWTTTVTGVTFADASNSSTTFTMPANAVTVTANFEPLYTVTVSSAGTSPSGGGGYAAGATVNINAGKTSADQLFKNWSVTVGGVTLANANDSATTFTMPANAVTVTAVFAYQVKVSSAGTGASGSGYYLGGETVTIAAGTPPVGYQFKSWTATGVTINNANSATATFTMMPVKAVTVTAVFETYRAAGTPVEYGGKTYRTVVIGKQTWMAENLNIQTGNSWCYGSNNSNCNTYGRLYDWNTAMAGAEGSDRNPSGVKGVCPAGWHLPSSAEWDALATAAGSWAGEKLKAKSGWGGTNGSYNGTDDFNFSALPGGYRYSGAFEGVGEIGTWWTSTEYRDGADVRVIEDIGDNVYDLYDKKANGNSVRCVKDN